MARPTMQVNDTPEMPLSEALLTGGCGELDSKAADQPSPRLN
jgi:hypothetical protein